MVLFVRDLLVCGSTSHRRFHEQIRCTAVGRDSAMAPVRRAFGTAFTRWFGTEQRSGRGRARVRSDGEVE